MELGGVTVNPTNKAATVVLVGTAVAVLSAGLFGAAHETAYSEVVIPDCLPGQEAQPNGEGYSCGPADLPYPGADEPLPPIADITPELEDVPTTWEDVPVPPIEPDVQLPTLPAPVTEHISEDDPRWDCRTMGNLTCGVEIMGTWYTVTFECGEPVSVSRR